MPALRLSRLAPVLALLLQLPVSTPSAAQGRLSGTVYDSLRTREMLSGAVVQVDGVVQTARTDTRGRFSLDRVPAGRRIVTFFHPMLDSMGLSAPVLAVEVPEDGLRDLRLALPSFATVGRAMCGAPLDSTTAIVIGRVREVETGEPLEGAQAEVEWVEMSLGDGARLRPQRRRAAAVATATGEFLLCGVPSDIDPPLVVWSQGASTGLVDLRLGGAPIATRDVAISLRDPGARVRVSARNDGADSTEAESVPGLARLRVTVRGEGGAPVADAIVGVRGTPVSTRSDSAGIATLVGVPSGSQTVLARTVGRAPASAVLPLRPGVTETLELRLDSAAVLLEDYVVRGIRPSPEREAFERRRRAGAGYFFDADDLARRGRGLAALRGTPGLFLDLGGTNLRPQLRMRSANGGRCAPTILYNGFPLPRVESWEIETLLQDAARVEVYSRPLSAPVELMTNRDCGAIGIWSF